MLKKLNKYNVKETKGDSNNSFVERILKFKLEQGTWKESEFKLLECVLSVRYRFSWCQKMQKIIIQPFLLVVVMKKKKLSEVWLAERSAILTVFVFDYLIMVLVRGGTFCGNLWKRNRKNLNQKDWNLKSQSITNNLYKDKKVVYVI